MSAKNSVDAPDRLTVKLDPADRAALDELSEEMDRSLGWLVRQAIREYVSRVRDSERGES